MYAALIVITAFITSVIVIQLTTPLAVRVGLVDRPGGHKLHDDHVPLVVVSRSTLRSFSPGSLLPVSDWAR